MIRVDTSINVNAPVEQVYRQWANFEDFPRFMQHLEMVRKTGPDTSHWVAKTPLGKLEWNARTTERIENKRISWNSTDGDINTTGTVIFEPAGRGTRVMVRLQYADPPGGKAAEAVASLLGVVERDVEADLERFKTMIEGAPTPATK
jgi:uncharacterized membrane protein